MYYDTYMNEPFNVMLAEGGKTNSLGRVGEVIEAVLSNHDRLDELYSCMLNDDDWIKMRAADAMEKICRLHPNWVEPYTDTFILGLNNDPQPSIQWHLAQIYTQVDLSDSQRATVILWLESILSTTDVDWIVAANAMTALKYFTDQGHYTAEKMREIFILQQKHSSKSVAKKASKLLSELM